MVLMECLVRKVTQNFFSDIMDNVEELITEVRSMELGIGVGNMMIDAEPEQKPELLDAALKKLLDKISDLRGKISEKVVKLAECPGPGTIIS